MIIFEDEYNGKPMFDVNFIDFCKIVCRDEKRCKFSLENESLMEHIVKTRYSRNYIVNYSDVKFFPKN